MRLPLGRLSGRTDTRVVASLLWVVTVVVCLGQPASAMAHQGLHEAISEATAKIQRDPRKPALYLLRSDLHRQHADFDAALADCDRAARLDPESADVDLARGRLLVDAGWLQSAELAISRVVERRPQEARGHELLGDIADRRGDHTRAAGEFARAIELEPQPAPELYLARARALVAHGEDDKYVSLAIAVLDEGMKRLGKPIVTLQLQAIELELRQRHFDAALARVETLAAQSERKEQWHLQRGDILRRAGRPAQAMQAYRDALAAIERLSPSRRQTTGVTSMVDHARRGLRELEIVPLATRPSEGKEHVDASRSTSRPVP